MQNIVLRDTGHFAALEAPDDWARIPLDDTPRAVAMGQPYPDEFRVAWRS